MRKKKTEKNRRQTPAVAKRQTDRPRKSSLEHSESEGLKKQYIKGKH